ncbi:MAG: flavocytochrome c [Pseudoflavonifractor sp.]
MRRWFLPLLLLALLTGCSASAGLQPGRYTAVAAGYNGELEVALTVDQGAILSVEILRSSETPQVAGQALTDLAARIVETQSIALDGVSGATTTSASLLAAAEDCLRQAGDEASLAPFRQAPPPHETVAPVQTLSAQVIVVGSGGAGLSAAVSAAEEGASVIVIEKMPNIGGNTVRSIGMYNCVDPALQGPLGIEDSEEEFFRETWEGGHREAKEDLVRVLTSQADEGKVWLESLGVTFDTVIDNCLGGKLARGHYARSHTGTDYIQALQGACTDRGVVILTQVTARSLLVENGRVVGVRADRDGQELLLTAERGVVLATGGFGYNVEMRLTYNESLTADMLCSNSPGATGDGILMAQEVGANLVNMQYIETYPMGDVYDGGLRNSIPNSINFGILVSQEGRRFVAEDSGRDQLSASMRAQTGGFAYSVTDGDYLLTKQDKDYLEGLVSMGTVVKAESLSDLAQKLKLPPDALAQTVADYNRGLAAGQDAFGRTTLYNAIDTPPYYANPRKPTVHYTLGGVEIDAEARVLTPAGLPIPGLFAAGEVTGGVHGANRLGGNSFPDIIVFGRIAGRGAATK